MRTLPSKLILGWRTVSFAFPEREANPMVHTRVGLAKPRYCIPRMRCVTLRCTLILGWRNLGFAVPERDATPEAHTHSALSKPKFWIPRTRCVTPRCTIILGRRNPGFALPMREANRIVHIHSGWSKPRLCIPRTRCEPYGANSFWVVETLVLHSQNEMRSILCILILGGRNLGFAFPERDASA